jgi:hypothetical protein
MRYVERQWSRWWKAEAQTNPREAVVCAKTWR